MTPPVINSRGKVAPISIQSTSGTPATLIAADPAGYLDLISLVLTNESASATIVSISDGTVTYKFALAANGGGVFTWDILAPLYATSPNVAWTISNSAADTVDVVATFQKAV